MGLFFPRVNLEAVPSMVFVDGEKATHYTATLTPAVNPAYEWHFVPPPDDPTCANASTINGGSELVFKHSDADGCHPARLKSPAQGRPHMEPTKTV